MRLKTFWAFGSVSGLTRDFSTAKDAEFTTDTVAVAVRYEAGEPSLEAEITAVFTSEVPSATSEPMLAW